MSVDQFETNTVALILAWLCGIGTFVGLACGLIDSSSGRRGWQLAIVVWSVACMLLGIKLATYVIWLLLVAGAYPWQSMGAFWSSLLLTIYVPIVFSLMLAIGFAAPIAAMLGLLEQNRIKPPLAFAISIPAIPVCAAVGSYLFFLALPLAAKSVQWLDPRDVVKATNGPGELWWRYAFNPANSPVAAGLNAEVIDRTPGTHKDVMRLHVAATYFSDDKKGWFLKVEYPSVYSYFTQQRMPRN